MTTYSYAQLEGIWLQGAAGTKYATKAWAALMAAIAEAESSGRNDALNATDNGGTQSSFGIWQISNGTHSPPSADWANPVTNAKLAVGKLESQGLGAWGTYTSGAYQKFMQGSVPPDANIKVGAGSGNAGSNIPNATDAGFNPFGFVEHIASDEFGWFGKLISGVTGIPSSIGDVATSISGMVRAITKITDLFLLLFRPEFWLRVGAGIFGLLALGAGLYFFKDAL